MPHAAREAWLVRRTACASLGAQLLTGIATIVAFALADAPELRTIFWLEGASQVVEFAWYATVLGIAGEVQTWTRYLDWYLSTPAVLASLALFLLVRAGRPEADVWSRGRIGVVLALNALMLSAGFASEVGAWSRGMGGVVGFAAFGASFAVLGAEFMDASDAMSVGIYAFTAAVWSLYGVAFFLAYAPKNVAYNALDVVSKNAYGVFLTVYALVR